MSPPIHPRIRFWFEMSELFAEAAVAGARRTRSLLQRRQPGAGRTRRPGPDTPMWNVCAHELHTALRRRGAATQLARYLGVPKQRITDFLSGRRRLPDAELTLRLLHWLAETRAGRDPSL